MELNEMEKRLLYQVEGDYPSKVLTELYMTARYTKNPEQREAALSAMAKLRALSDTECMDLVRDIQKNYRLPYPARTIGEKLAEARQKSGAQKLKGHDIMALERFDPEVRHSLDPGRRLKLEHSVSCEGADISDLTGMSTAALQAMREESVAGENKAFEIVLAAVKQWEKQAAVTQRIDRAMEYVRTQPIKHTANQWQENEYGTGEQISNMVYTMTARIWENTKYDRETKEMIPVAWYVSWDVYAKGPGQNGYTASIAGQRNKRYTDKAAALKYLEGRKKAYAHLFTEISPPIPPKYADLFKVNGQLLPGYTIEGQAPIQPEHATAEVSDGGISLPQEAEKPSMLGRLSASKAQQKAPSAAHAAEKKKEDMSR